MIRSSLLAKQNRLSGPHLLLYSAGTAIIGVAVLVSIFASGTPVSFEPEKGTRTGQVTIVNDSLASGGGYIKFGAAAPTPTPTVTTAIPIPATGAYWGTIKDPASYPDASGNLGDYSLAQREKVMNDAESIIGRKYDIDRQFFNWGDDPFAANPTPNGYLKWSSNTAGHIMLINLVSTKNTGGQQAWSSIANGSQDAYLHTFAADMKAWGKPAWFTFLHEPEGHICPNDTLTGCDLTQFNGTTADYKAAWRHIVTLFRADHVTNVSYAWLTAAYHWSYPNDYRYEPNAYPGDDVIDWMGVDPFNVVTNKNTGVTNMADWKSLSALISPWYAWASQHNKPLMLSAVGSREDPSDPTRRAQWFTQAHSDMKTSYPMVKGVIYYDVNPSFELNNDWRIFSGPQAAINAYKAWGIDSYFNTRNCNVTACTGP